MNDINDILSPGAGGHGKLTEEKLQAYLEGRLSADEQREVEQWLAEEGMESDAMDGLLELEPSEAKTMVSQLNRRMSAELKQKKRTRRKYYTENRWVMVAILLILLFALLGYVVIQMMKTV